MYVERAQSEEAQGRSSPGAGRLLALRRVFLFPQHAAAGPEASASSGGLAVALGGALCESLGADGTIGMLLFCAALSAVLTRC
eukprot:SAG25_NODE_798_length_5273_cov_3.375145_4_plen_83_part_00